MAREKTPTETPEPTGSSDQTRLALVHAALRLFGEKGFDGASTREIATAAKANIGSIAYHFGGKEGLREACAAYIVEMISGVAGQALPTEAAQLSPEAARRQLLTGIEAMVGFIVARPEAGEIVQFVLRELAHPTSALDIVYKGVFEPVHRRLCQVWEAATGDPAESERTRITVFTLIGQVVYFRIGREAVLRRMGWKEIGAAEAQSIVTVARDNVAAVLKSRKELGR